MTDITTDSDLINTLRRSASHWFKDDDLLLLEELIRRYHQRRNLVRIVPSIISARPVEE